MEEAQAIECREALVTNIGTWNLKTRREIAMKPSWVQCGLDLYVVTFSISWHDILWHVDGLGKDGIVEEDIGMLIISDYGLLLIIDRLGPRSGQDRRWFISPRHVLSNSSPFPQKPNFKCPLFESVFRYEEWLSVAVRMNSWGYVVFIARLWYETRWGPKMLLLREILAIFGVVDQDTKISLAVTVIVVTIKGSFLNRPSSSYEY